MSTGVVSSIGGITRFRTMADMKGTIQDSQDAFDTALSNAKNRQAAAGSMSIANSQPLTSFNFFLSFLILMFYLSLSANNQVLLFSILFIVISHTLTLSLSLYQYSQTRL